MTAYIQMHVFEGAAKRRTGLVQLVFGHLKVVLKERFVYRHLQREKKRDPISSLITKTFNYKGCIFKCLLVGLSGVRRKLGRSNFWSNQKQVIKRFHALMLSGQILALWIGFRVSAVSLRVHCTGFCVQKLHQWSTTQPY